MRDDAGNSPPAGLKAYLDRVGTVVKNMPSAWVKCELHALKELDRCTRMEFIELDEAGKQIASARGVCWSEAWTRIGKVFSDAGLPLEAGSQVLVKLEANLHASFGFQVTVLDIDVTFALGDLNARLQAIRRNLQELQIWDNNRALLRPADFVRVAVISPAGAAGLGDFRSTTDRLAAAGLAEFVFHEAPFQTREAPARIVEILRRLYRECQHEETRFCAVAIIRGGGASADLAWLVDQKLAEAVCKMNVPVMTGIGHERDRNLLDEVACIPCDTPSKVAEHISSTIIRSATAAHHASELIRKQAGQILDQCTVGLANARHAVHRDSNEALRLAEADLRATASGLEPGARTLLDETHSAVLAILENASRGARQRREAAANALQALRRQVETSVEAELRSLEVGKGRAMSEIATLADAIPPAASTEIARLHEQIRSDATRAADDLSVRITAARDQVISQAMRVVDDCAAAIATIQERADAVHPRTVLAAGYAILRDENGAPLTRAASLPSQAFVVAEMRDGTADLYPAPINDKGEKR